MNKLLALLADSPFTQTLATLVFYSLYAVVLGLSLAPSLYLLYHVLSAALAMTAPAPLVILYAAVACGFAVYLYFVTGVLVMGSAVRLLSLGIRAGSYPLVSVTTLRWLAYSGVYHLATTTVLCHIPMSFFGNLFFRIVGAKLGRNVRLNTWMLNDAFLLTIGDNVVIGGKTDVSCHTTEGGRLLLKPITIGADSLIGQGCYISPGTVIGRGCVIGQYSFLRKNTTVPDRTVLSAIAAMPIRAVARIEKSASDPDSTIHAAEAGHDQ